MLKYIEEALAEGIATRSIKQGLMFPLKTPGYELTGKVLIGQGMGVGAGIGALIGIANRGE